MIVPAYPGWYARYKTYERHDRVYQRAVAFWSEGLDGSWRGVVAIGGRLQAAEELPDFLGYKGPQDGETWARE